MVKLVVVVVAIILGKSNVSNSSRASLHKADKSVFHLSITAIAFAACYGVCSGNSDTERCDNITSGAAALEWT